MVLFVYTGYSTYYAKNVLRREHGLYLLDQHSLLSVIFAISGRALKTLEGIFYTFVPINAFSSSIFHATLVAFILLTAWSYIFYEIAVSHGRNKSNTLKSVLLQDHPSVDLLAIGLSMSLALGFGGGLRTLAPNVIFLFLAIATKARATKSMVGAMMVVAGIYLWGIYLNYDANAGPCFSLSALRDSCNGPWVPNYNWEQMRQAIVDEFVRKYLK